MTEVKELMEAQVPLRIDEQPDWTDVLQRVGMNGAAPRMFRRRRVLIPVLLVLALVVTGAAIAAAVGGIPWWETAPTPKQPEIVDNELDPTIQGDGDLPHPDRSRARAVAEKKGIELVAAPVGENGYCFLLFTPESKLPVNGRSCVFQASPDSAVQASDYTTTVSYAQPSSDGEARWVVYGRITDPNAAALDLSDAAGFTFRTQLENGGFFLVEVPQADWTLLSNRVGRGRVLDRSGATVRIGCVSWGPAPGALGAGAMNELLREDAPRCRPVRMPWSVEVAGATKLVGLHVTNPLPGNRPGDSMAIWRAEQKDGTVCVFEALASPDPTWPGTPHHPARAGGNPPNQVVCDEDDTLLDRTPPDTPIDVGIEGGSFDGRWQYDLVGHVDPNSGIERVELRSSTQPVELAYDNHWFVAQFPAGGARDELPPDGQYELVGYDGDGHEAARVDLQRALTRAERQGCSGLSGMYACADREPD